MFGTTSSQADTAFTPNFVTFDGTNDYLTTGAGLTGSVDGKTGIFYCSISVNSDGSIMNFIRNGSTNVILRRESGNQLRIFLRTDAPSQLVDLTTTNTLTVSDGVTNVLMSWDVANNYAQVYLDDVLAGSSATTTDGNIDYTTNSWNMMAFGGAELVNGNVANAYFSMNQTALDISIAANRRLFYGTDGVSTDLSSTPAAIIKFTGNAAAWNAGTNEGTGGNFTMTGAVVDV